MLAGAVPGGTALAMSTPWMRMRNRGFAYLVNRQSKDGAWRSNVYGSFKTGEGLTPLVANACWSHLQPKMRDATVQWLQAMDAKTWALFPVHNAGWLLSLAKREKRLEEFVPVLAGHLRGLQFSSERGWKEGEFYHGGWSYAGTPVVNEVGRKLAAMQEPNLSATVLAVAGLRHAGVAEDDPVLAQAVRFISSCQNLRAKDRGKFDDGGFFQMANDISRNKAGVAGLDASGRKRFRSYYSATADGLRGLLMCGVKITDPRVVAARSWMERNPAMDDVPDLTFYANFARAQAGNRWSQDDPSPSPHPLVRQLGPRPTDRPPRITMRKPGFYPNAVPGTFPSDNSLGQGDDGSYCNPAGEMRENDPLVATALMMMASGLRGRR